MDGLRGGGLRSIAPAMGTGGGGMNNSNRHYGGMSMEATQSGRGPPGSAVGISSGSGKPRAGGGGVGAAAGSGISKSSESHAGAVAAAELGEGSGMVDIPDAIPAELLYQVGLS